MPSTDAIAVTCSHCEAHFRVKPEAAGRSVKCPQCRERTQVESADGNGPDPALEWLGISGEDSLAEPPIIRPEIHEAKESRPAAPKPVMVHDANIEPRRYPALTIVQYALYAFAIIGALQWLLISVSRVIAMTGGATATEDSTEAFAASSLLLVSIGIHTAISLIAICLTVAAAELIRVILHIQDDTRRAALYASRLPLA